MSAALIFLTQPGGQRLLVNLSNVAFMKHIPAGTQIVMTVEGRSTRILVEETMDDIVEMVTR